MKKFTDDFIKLLDFDEFERRLESYNRVIKSEEWKFVKDVFTTIKGQMALDMFSHKYSTLDATEKDVRQRAYFQINLMLEFLSEPRNWIKQKISIKNKYLDLQSKVKKPNSEKEKK